MQLDFNDVELSVVIDTIARLTNKNFIYDDRVRGRVTIVSPTSITVDEAYAVFESVLQVKGFTTVTGPGGAIKVIPIREAKESNIETLRGARTTPDSDRTITRLIPLQYIDAEAITNTLKPLVSKDASMVAYPAHQHGDPDRRGVEHPPHPDHPPVHRRGDLQGGAHRHQGPPRRCVDPGRAALRDLRSRGDARPRRPAAPRTRRTAAAAAAAARGRRQGKGPDPHRRPHQLADHPGLAAAAGGAAQRRSRVSTSR